MNASQSMKFGHFGINCFDVARMEDFYTRVVGMVVADRGHVPAPANRHIVFMTLDPGEHTSSSSVRAAPKAKSKKDPSAAAGSGRPSTRSPCGRACAARCDERCDCAQPDRLHAEMTRIVKMPEVRERIASLDLIPVEPAPIEETQRYIAAETKKWGNVIRSLGLEGSQ